MPVSMAVLLSGSSGVDASSYNTASYTPSANKLIIAAIVSRLNTATPNTPTLSGNGLTWVQIATVLYYDIATPGVRITLFRAMGASPSAGAMTIDHAGQTQISCGWSIIEFGNIDTGGVNGSAAVVQSATNASDSAATLTVTLAAFGSVDNATYGAFSWYSSGGINPGTGFTEIHNFLVGDQAFTILESEWRSDNDTTVDTTGPATYCAGIAVEIKFMAPVSAFVQQGVVS